MSRLAAWTPLLVAANVLVFGAMVAANGSFAAPPPALYLEWGATHAPAIAAGEFWRLVTSAFLHFGPAHLVFNMWALWGVGALVEDWYGGPGFLLLYFGSAALGGLASAGWYGDAAVSAGASGAIFGLYGAMGAFLLLRSDALPEAATKALGKSALAFVAVSVYLGFSHEGIDNAAHLAGGVAGFVLGLPFAGRGDGTPALRFLVAAALACGAVLLFATALS